MYKASLKEESDPPIDVLCQDVETEDRGQLTVDGNDWAFKIVSFQGKPPPSQSERTLQLENGHYATLLACQDGGDGYASGLYVSGNTRLVYPDVIVLGPEPWSSRLLTKHFSFAFFKGKESVHYSELSSEGYKAPPKLATFVIDGIEVSLGLQVSFSLGGGIAKSRPRVYFDSPRGLSVGEIYRIAADALTFFEISAGVPSYHYDFSINPLDTSEIMRAIEHAPNHYYPEFSLRFMKPEMPPERPAGREFPVFTFLNEQRAKQSAIAFERWMTRRAEWSYSYTLASRYLHANPLFDINRLLRAMAWFESLPSYASKDELTDTQVGILKRAARSAAESAGIAITPARIAETMNQLRRESLNGRLERCITSLRTRFGMGYLPERILQDCSNAKKIRDSAAHGFSSGADIQSLYEYTLALEILCFLATVEDLNPDFSTAYMHPLTDYLRLRSLGTTE